MKNILILGNGFIASHLPYKILKTRLMGSESEIKAIINAHKPDVIINCIGFCGNPNIDQCEDDKQRTIFANTQLPLQLASETNRFGIQLITIGSGCIFYGRSPNVSCEEGNIVDPGWREGDVTKPLSTYSTSKYAADLAMNCFDNVTNLRIRMPISNKNNSRNIINKLSKYNKIIDIPNSMTFVDDLVRCIDWCITNDKMGTYHVVNEKPLTAKLIMEEYVKYVPSHKFSIISESDLDSITNAKRSNCILDGSKLKSHGFKMSDSFEALSKTMREYFE